MNAVTQMLEIDRRLRMQLPMGPAKPIQWIPTDAERRAKIALQQSAQGHAGRIGQDHGIYRT